MLTEDAPENVHENRRRLGARRRPPVGALLLRPAGARDDASAAPPSRRRRAALHRGGRPGDRADRRRRDRLRRRLPAGPARRRGRGRRAALRLAAAGGRDHRRGRQGAPRGRRDRPDHRRDRPRRPRLLLRGRGGGPRALRAPTTRGAASATSTSRRWPRSNSATTIEIVDTGLCTICDERFFSHRRDHGITGRQSGVICRA